MRIRSEKFTVQVDFNKIAEDAKEQGYGQIKIFYMVESFVKKDNGMIAHLISVSPRSKTPKEQLFLSTEFDPAENFKMVSKRTDIRAHDYYTLIMSPHVISTETKFRIQFDKTNVSVLIESLDNNSLAIAKVSHNSDSTRASDEILTELDSVDIIDIVTNDTMESVFYYHAVS